jgi:hypothetical protein
MQGFIDDVVDFVKDNTLAAVLIVAAVLLLIVLVVFLIVWLRRRKAAASQAYPSDLSPVSDEWQPGLADRQARPGASLPSALAVSAGGFQTSPKGAALPTVAQGGTATSAPTAGPGYVPPPGGLAPPPFQSPMPPGQAGATRVLERAPKHVAMLINRKNPSQRFDLLALTDIGRGQGNAVVISDTTVSRQHARIRLEEDKFLLFDLGSANGTFVNGQRLEQPVTLAENDVVRFGEIEFTFKQLS